MKRFWSAFLIACLLIASLWANASAMTMWDYYWGKDGYAVKLTQADLDDIEQMWKKSIRFRWAAASGKRRKCIRWKTNTMII